MSWTKQTKVEPGESIGWGEGAWGTGIWGGVTGTAWTAVADASDIWILKSLVYDSGVPYNNDYVYDGDFITAEIWTKVPDAS